MRKFTILAVFIVLGFADVKSQDKITDHNNNIWFLVHGNYYLSEKFGLDSEAHLRLADMGGQKQQMLLRPSIYYKLTDQVRFYFGYTYINTYPYGTQPVAARTPENNLWAQVTLNHSVSKLGLSHRYRLEKRWIGKLAPTSNGYEVQGTTQKNRLRYRLTLKYTLPNQDKFYVAAFDEIFINYGKDTRVNFFDQNWIYSGLGYNLSEGTSLELAYQWQLIEKADGISEESNNTLVLSLHYNLPLGKNGKD